MDVGFTITELRPFLRSCGADPEKFSREGQKMVDKELDRLSELLKNVEVTTSTDAQGTSHLLRRLGSTKNFSLTGTGESCNK